MAKTKLAKQVREKKAKKVQDFQEHIGSEPIKSPKKVGNPKRVEKVKTGIGIDFSKKENAKKLFFEQNLLVFKEDKKSEKWHPVYDYWLEENKVLVCLGRRIARS